MNIYKIIDFIGEIHPKYKTENLKIFPNIPHPTKNGHNDDNGRQGEWKKEDEDYVTIINYHNDKKSGVSTTYMKMADNSLQIERIKTYKNDVLDGPYVIYYPTRNIMVKGEYENNYRTGDWYTYSESEKLSVKQTFSNKGQTSYKIDYYNNGNITIKGHYQNGQKEGMWEHYHTNGNIEAKGIYKLSHEDGMWDYFDENGKKRYSIEYDFGRKIKKYLP